MHPVGTIELVTARVGVGFAGEEAEQDYELTYGLWNEVQGLSANGYWRPASEPVADYERVLKTGTVMCRNVTGNQPSFVKCFADRDAFVEFIEFYMRGTILDTVVEPA